MKQLLYLILLFFCSYAAFAQDLTFSFSNAVNTHDGGTDYYEIDVMIASTTPFKLGSGQLYFNYNPAAFGDNIFANNRVEITYPSGYLLGQKDNWLGLVDVYGDFVENDNTNGRFSFAWQQSKGGDCINQNVGLIPEALFHLKLKYLDLGQSPDFCFESAPVFTGQTFTHCGPNDGTCLLSDENCVTDPGTQITNNFFICAEASLPVELTQFTAHPFNATDALLNWQTSSEVNTSHFAIARSKDGINWEIIGEEPAVGESSVAQNYRFVDEQIHLSGGLAKEYYYRLKIVDWDGSFEFSEVRQVVFKGSQAMAVFPNPTTWGVNIISDQEEDLPLVEVYALDGRLLLQEVLHSGAAQLHFPISMQAGIYNLVIRDQAGEPSYHRVVLQR